jgi:MFS family permease
LWINQTRNFYIIYSHHHIHPGTLSDRVGRKILIYPGMIIQSVGIWVVLYASFTLGWIVRMSLLGVGTALVYPTLLAAISDVAHPKWRATSLGFIDFGETWGMYLAR